MQGFEKRDRYNSRTGKKIDTEMVPTYSICDYCGKRIGEDENTEVLFEIHEVGGSEESYYYREFEGVKEGIDFDGRKVFTEHEEYVYCTDDDGESCSRGMLSTWDASNPENLEALMQHARIKVVVRLLNEGMTPEDLGIQGD